MPINNCNAINLDSHAENVSTTKQKAWTCQTYDLSQVRELRRQTPVFKQYLAIEFNQLMKAVDRSYPEPINKETTKYVVTLCKMAQITSEVNNPNGVWIMTLNLTIILGINDTREYYHIDIISLKWHIRNATNGKV